MSRWRFAIEAAELMEHFQWLTTDASRELASDPEKLAEVGEELADVIGYSFALANELGWIFRAPCGRRW